MENKRGLTLVEVVVAMAVFMIIVVMAFPILTQSGLINAQSKQKLDAQEIGVLIVEDLIFVSKTQKSQMDLIERLKDHPLPSFTNKFTHEPSSNQLSMHEDGFDIQIELNDDSNLVKIIVLKDRQRYETLEWLIYD